MTRWRRYRTSDIVREIWPVGTRVVTSARWPNALKSGSVVGYVERASTQSDDCVKVLWDGTKTPTSIHRSFIERSVRLP